MLESDYMKKLGSSIRFYRTKANLTQGELASQIGKSLASVSKYERGDCAIDCYTLSEIASALGLRIIQLLPGESSPARQPDSAPAQQRLTRSDTLYLFYIGSHTRKLRFSVLKLSGSSSEVLLYVGVRDKNAINQCSYIMLGTICSSSASTNIWTVNPEAPEDYFHIVVNGADWYSGSHVCQISYSTSNWRSVTSKAYISETPEVSDHLEELLAFSKEELKQIKSLHQLVL